MIIRVVFDVNIYVSAAANPNGLPDKVVTTAVEAACEIFYSDPILDKLDDVLTRPYFLTRLSNRVRNEVRDRIISVASPAEPDESVQGVAPDAEDDLVLGTAVKANADFLVTGDKGLLAIRKFRGVRIVTAGEFLAELETA